MGRQMTPQEALSPKTLAPAAGSFAMMPATSAPTLMSGLHFTFQPATFQPSPERQLQDAYMLEKASLAALHGERLRWTGVRHFWSRLNKYFVETKQNIRLLETFMDDDAILETLNRAEKGEGAGKGEGRGIAALTNEAAAHYETMIAAAPDEDVLGFCEQALVQKQEMAEWMDETLPQFEGAFMPAAAGEGETIHRC